MHREILDLLLISGAILWWLKIYFHFRYLKETKNALKEVDLFEFIFSGTKYYWWTMLMVFPIFIGKRVIEGRKIVSFRNAMLCTMAFWIIMLGTSAYLIYLQVVLKVKM